MCLDIGFAPTHTLRDNFHEEPYKRVEYYLFFTNFMPKGNTVKVDTQSHFQQKPIYILCGFAKKLYRFCVYACLLMHVCLLESVDV